MSGVSGENSSVVLDDRISVSVCLSASTSPELGLETPSSPIFASVIWAYSHGSSFWRPCGILGTSGFVDDVMSAHNGQKRRREEGIGL